MSLISSSQTANMGSTQTSSGLTTESKTIKVSTLTKSLHSSQMHRSAPEASRSISDDVQKLKSIYSTYQRRGQPLSKEAIFHAKQKYGILNTPANYKTLGLGDFGSESADLAARLANKKTESLTNDSVGSTIEQKAQKEAYKITFSKIPLTPPEEVPMKVNLGLKGKRDFLTRTAAQKALASSFSSDDSTIAVSNSSSVNKSKSRGFTVGSEFDVGAVNPHHPAGFKSLDLSKVLDGAERRAIGRVNSRLYPQKLNFQNGLQTGKESGLSEANKEVFKKGTLEKLERSAEQFLESQPSIDRQRLNDRQYMYAKSAADAVKDLDPKALEDPNFAAKELQKKMYLKQVSSPVVLHEAQKLANKKLQDIDSSNTYMLLFGNQAYNKLAVKIALEHYSTNQRQKKKIYLGGGLWTTPEEVDTVARNLISPLVNEIDERARRQRDVDRDIERRRRVLDQEYEDWNYMERTKDQNDRQVLLAVASKQEQEKVTDTAERGQNYDLFVLNENSRVQQKERELQTAKQNRENLRIELQEILSKNLSAEKDDLTGWNESCERDLKNTSIEQAQVFKSNANDLRVSEKEYDELVGERNEIQRKIKKLDASIAERRIVIRQFEERSSTGGDLAAKQYQNVRDRDYLLDATLNDPVVLSAEKAKEEAELATEEVTFSQLQINQMAANRKIRLHEYERQLRKGKEAAVISGNNTTGKGKLTNDPNVCQGDEMYPSATNEISGHIGEKASPKATIKSRFLSTYNTGKDVDSSASARSVTGVSGVLDEKSEIPNKETVLPGNGAMPDNARKAPDEIYENPILAKNDKPLRPAADAGGSITIEQFLFNKKAQKKDLSGTKSATMKSDSVLNQMGSENEDELAHRADRGRRSFSGFSQGSTENDYSNEVTDDQDESDIKVRDSNDSNTSRKESFFKEII